MRISQTADMNRLTRIISRLRHSYYICDRSGTLGVRGIQSAMQTHLTVTVFSHMEYRTILLPVCTSSVLPAYSCRIACDTRIYSTAMRRLRFSRNAPSLTRYARTLRMPVRDGSRSRSSFQNGEVIGGRRHDIRPFRHPRISPSTLLIGCCNSEVTKIRIVLFTHPLWEMENAEAF